MESFKMVKHFVSNVRDTYQMLPCFLVNECRDIFGRHG
jgi:hypothetical protein